MIYLIIGVIALLVIYVLVTYNVFVKMKNRVDESFSTMDVYLKKRWDLIPNIVETVKGYAKHEKSTLSDVIKLRNGAYDNMSSTKHNFKEVNLFDVYDFIEKGGSGIFYLGYTSCHNCMTAVQYINQAAEEMGVTVYYINIDREDYHVADNKDVYNEVVEKLNPILGKDATGEKGIFTPDVFQVINGEFGDYFVGLTDDFDASNPEKTKKLVDVYKNLMKPFKKAA